MMSELNLDNDKLNKIKYLVLKAEQENLRTRTLNNREMTEKIRRIIEEEVRKCY